MISPLYFQQIVILEYFDYSSIHTKFFRSFLTSTNNLAYHLNRYSFGTKVRLRPGYLSEAPGVEPLVDAGLFNARDRRQFLDCRLKARFEPGAPKGLQVDGPQVLGLTVTLGILMECESDDSPAPRVGRIDGWQYLTF